MKLRYYFTGEFLDICNKLFYNFLVKFQFRGNKKLTLEYQRLYCNWSVVCEED